MKLTASMVSAQALEAISAASQVVGRPIIRAGSADFHFPDETVLVALSFESVAPKSIRIVRSSAEADQVLTVESGSIVYITAGLRLVDVSRIYLTSDSDPAVTGSVTLDLSYLGRRFTSPPMLVEWPAGKGERQILELQSDRTDRRKELIAHLNANRVYYSNAIHQALDSGTIVAMLAEYSWNGRPLIDQVEPQPLTMAGNYLVFRAPVEPVDISGVKESGKDVSWGDLLHNRAIITGKQSADERLIPLPTAGVFAEAVLGRSNSAEKLDITRFWNWQDSPIPLTPTEIAPVGTGSRAMAEDLKPGQLGQPILNIVNPQTLPNPAGLGAVLGTIATPNMFRDMSGLAGTQGLVQTGMQETMQAATDAGQLASANMRTEAQKAVAMGQIAADIVKSVMGGGASGSSPSQGVSGAGAMINHGKSMDKVSGSSSPAGSGGGPLIAGGASGSSPAANARTLSGTQVDGSSPGNEQAAFQRALYGELGASGIDAAKSTLAAWIPNSNADIAIGADGGANDGGEDGGAGGSISLGPSLTVLPDAYGGSPQPDPKMMQAFQDAVNALSVGDRALIDKVAFTVVKLTQDGSPSPVRISAGVDQILEHYSASLVKVAAMYAAFELWKKMKQLQAQIRAATSGDLQLAAKARFDQQIKAAVPDIVHATDITDLHVLPKYRAVRTGPGGLQHTGGGQADRPARPPGAQTHPQ